MQILCLYLYTVRTHCCLLKRKHQANIIFLLKLNIDRCTDVVELAVFVSFTLLGEFLTRKSPLKTCVPAFFFTKKNRIEMDSLFLYFIYFFLKLFLLIPWRHAKVVVLLLGFGSRSVIPVWFIRLVPYRY